LFIDIKRYKPGTSHEDIMEDWQTDEKLELWRTLYDHTKIEIRLLENGWIALGVHTET